MESACTHAYAVRMIDENENESAAEDLQLLAMAQVRGIRLASRSLYGAMHHAFGAPDGSVERAAAMLSLDEQISDFLSLPGNSPSTAILAVGRIAAEVAGELGARTGLSQERLGRQVDQYLLATGFSA